MLAPLQKKTEIKVYILYVMKNIGYPVEFDKLHDTVTADEPVTPFAFAECFSELLDTENVELIRGDDKSEAFMITQKGLNVCESLLYMLIPSVQKTALSAALRLVSFEQKGMEISVTLKQQPQGVQLSFCVFERKKKVFSLEMMMDNLTQALAVEEKLKRHPEQFYKSVYNMLNTSTDYFD